MISAVSLAVKALLADAGVTALTSTRIAPDPLPQTTTLPAVSIALVDEVEERINKSASVSTQNALSTFWANALKYPSRFME